MSAQAISCKHCGQPTRMLGTQMCDGCWSERRSGRMDSLEAALKACRGPVEHCGGIHDDRLAEIDRLLGSTSDASAKPA
jgi:hypothetical protein